MYKSGCKCNTSREREEREREEPLIMSDAGWMQMSMTHLVGVLVEHFPSLSKWQVFAFC